MNLGKGCSQLQCSSEDEIEEDLIISQSPLSNLILEINKLLKKPTIDEELGNILLKFIEKLKESESYLKNGIFNISFTEASLLLQSGCVLYGKRVELLWNDVTECLRRFCSYHRKGNNGQTESSEKEEELLLQKMNRFKRRKVVHDQKTNSNESAASSIGNLHQLTSSVPSLSQIVSSSCKNLDYMWSEAAQSSSKLTRVRAKVTSLTDNYIRKAIINSKNKGDKICNYHELYLNLHQSGFMLYDDKTTQMYNLRHLVDNVLQSYLSQREITFVKLAECDMWDDFKKYLEQTIVKRLNALVKVQRELMNGGWDRRRPLIAQKPPVDLSMLRFFGKYNVNSNVADEESVDQEDDDIEEETALVANSDRDSGVTSAPSSPAKSFTSRRTSEMHSEADSAFQDGCSFNGDDVVVEEEMERNSDKEKHTTSDANLNADDSGYFDESSSPGKTLNDPGESGISDGDFSNLESKDNSEKNNDSDQGLEVIQGFGLYNEEDEEEKEENETQENRDDVEEMIVDQKEEEPPVEKLKKKEKKKEEKLKDLNTTKQCRKKRKYEETGSNEDEIQRTKLFKKITTSLKKQEKFFLRFYRPEANEGGISSTEYSDDEECDCEDEKLKDHSKIVYLILSEHSYHKLSPSSSSSSPTSSESPTFSAEEVHDDENPSEPPHLLLSPVVDDAAPTGEESRPESARSNNDNNEDSNTSAYANNDEEDGDDEDSDDVNIETEHSRPIIVDDKRMFSERRVALLEWKSFIEPKLEEATRKPDFDIYEYGSRVMDAIPIGECRSFEQVVKDESPSEVSRFFMATLQLANTYNVELQNIPEGRLANDKMQVKLVSKKRYHEQLRGYVAPSKDSLKRRLHQANSEGLARCKRQKMGK